MRKVTAEKVREKYLTVSLSVSQSVCHSIRVFLFVCFIIITNKKKIYRNKDDNIHKSEGLKRWDRRTLNLVECQN